MGKDKAANPRTDLLQGTLDMLILRVLSSGEMHGWGIADRIQIVSNNVLSHCSRETAAQILMGGAHLYGFTEADFQKADEAAGKTQTTGRQQLEITVVA